MGTFLNCSFSLSIIGLILESLTSLFVVMLLAKYKKRLIYSNWFTDIISET